MEGPALETGTGGPGQGCGGGPGRGRGSQGATGGGHGRGGAPSSEPKETKAQALERTYPAEFACIKDFFSRVSGPSDDDIAKVLTVRGADKSAREKRFAIYRKMASLMVWPMHTPFPAAVEAAVKAMYPEAEPANYVSFVSGDHHQYTDLQEKSHRDAVLEIQSSRAVLEFQLPAPAPAPGPRLPPAQPAGPVSHGSGSKGCNWLSQVPSPLSSSRSV